jgi:hypothetical protein
VLQNRNYAPRVELTSPAFYLRNLLAEPGRYGLGGALARGLPGAWVFVIALAGGAVVLWRRGPRALLWAPLAVMGLFALFLEQKNRMYLASVWPLLALVASAGVMEALARPGLPRLAGAGALLVAAMAGGLAWAQLLGRARRATPAAALAVRLAEVVPSGGRILAPPWTWLLLHERAADFRAINVPINLATPGFTATPVHLAAAIDAVDADAVLLDEPLVRFLEEGHGTARELRAYLSRDGAAPREISDPTYGRLQLWRLSR